MKNPDVEREVNRENKENTEEKEKILPIKEQKNRKKDETKLRDKVLVNRERDTKLLAGKSYRDREERKHERDNKHKKHEDKKLHKREDKDVHIKEDRNKNKEFKDDCHQKEKYLEEKRGKSYEKMRQEKRLRLSELKKQSTTEDNIENPKELIQNKKHVIEKKKILTNTEGDDGKFKETAPCKVTTESKYELMKNDTHKKIRKNVVTGMKASGSQGDVTDNQSEKISRVFKDNLDEDTSNKIKINKRRSSLESGGENGGGDGGHLRRHKSLDGGDDGDLQKNQHDDKDKTRKDKRKERRIRNKVFIV